MRTTILSTLAIAVLFVASSFTGKDVNGAFNANTSKSTVAWLGKKVTGEHNGHISLKSATLDVKKGKLTGGEFVIDMTSITNEDIEDAGYKEKLVGHLKSDDFFGVEKYPTSKFVITKVEHKGGNDYQIAGNLTIKEKTEKIEFPATVEIGDDEVTASAKLVIDRSKFDVRYGSGSFFDGLGDKMIYDDFELDINIVANN